MHKVLLDKTTIILSFIIGSRFLGLFIVLPVISLYGSRLEGASPFLVGLIVGIYALFQMIFSTPFGLLSDRFGRKSAMVLGLIIFIAGSLICALSDDIYSMLLGRILQGAGSIGAVASAMIADLVPEENRGAAMAVVGSSIGLSFIAAIILGPLMARFLGLSSLFYLCIILSVLCIFLLYALPKESRVKDYKSKERASFTKDLLLMYLTSFMQRVIISSSFMLIPLGYVKLYSEESLYLMYLAAIALGFLAMGLAGVLGESRGLSKHILISGVALFALSSLLFLLPGKALYLAAIFVFFLAFCLHEPIMQSSVSKLCKVSQKGLVLGIFNGFGYAGSFTGGLMGGLFLHFNALNALYISIFLACLIWLVLMLFMNNPNNFKNLYLNKGLNLNLIAHEIGILEAYENGQNSIIKYNKSLVSDLEIKSKLGLS